jgi:hypothetical protein
LKKILAFEDTELGRIHGTEIDGQDAEQNGAPKASKRNKESESSLQQHAHLVLRRVASIDEHGEKKSGVGTFATSIGEGGEQTFAVRRRGRFACGDPRDRPHGDIQSAVDEALEEKGINLKDCLRADT